jgi:hypothetical protein
MPNAAVSKQPDKAHEAQLRKTFMIRVPMDITMLNITDRQPLHMTKSKMTNERANHTDSPLGNLLN